MTTFNEYLHDQIEEYEIDGSGNTYRHCQYMIMNQIYDALQGDEMPAAVYVVWRKFNPPHIKMLQELDINSVCGRDAIAAIERAAAFIVTMHEHADIIACATAAAIHHISISFFG